jgi:hypothetical protein
MIDSRQKKPRPKPRASVMLLLGAAQGAKSCDRRRVRRRLGRAHVATRRQSVLAAQRFESVADPRPYAAVSSSNGSTDRFGNPASNVTLK